MSKTHLVFRVFLVVLTTLIVTGAILAIGIYFPYRPTAQEAIGEVLALEGKEMIHPHFRSRFENVEIIQVIAGAEDAQLVVATYEELTDGILRKECFSGTFVTQHWWFGTRAYSSFGQCKPLPDQPLIPPLVMRGYEEGNSYTLIGMPIDEAIAYVQAVWDDGVTQTIPVMNDAFVFFRQNNVVVKWVTGLDEQQQVISNTKVYNEDIHFTLFDYEAFRQVSVDGGVIIMGSYHYSGYQPKSCIELTYLTEENAKRYLQGQEAFTGQRLCYAPNGTEMVSPTINTNFSSNTVAGGIVTDKAITQIRLEWSDGFHQVVPVINGFFFAERLDVSATVVARQGLNREGSVLP